ncbi:hypothetical protein [Sphingobium sp. CFD-2]|uniref:hypothetical protein n=1 Tax=Sphingobium sp. CFD-2 TaxID=2878542 RepID=UPI00214B056B|nr:hypothetical protein [Sphingobium sp. CFD-2]
MSLSRDSILGYVDADIGTVDVPEMGGAVRIATLSVDEMDKLTKLDDAKPASAQIVIIGACDDKGVRLFTPEDFDQIAKLPAGIISRISKAILAHNGMGPAAAEEAKNASSETAN